MTEHLDRETCQDLKDAELEQTLDRGDWYYNRIGKLCLAGVGWAATTNYIKCPSTDTLMEAVAKELGCERVASLSIGGRFNGRVNASDEWSKPQDIPLIWFSHEGPNYPAALAALWLKIKNEVK